MFDAEAECHIYRLMQAAFDYAVEYVHDRKQFGQPIGEFQLMQGALEPWFLRSL